MPADTATGCVTISDLKVTDPGTFDLTASNSFCDPYTYSSLNIEKLTITIESSSTPTALFDHTLDVSIKASSGSLYSSSINVLLSAVDSVIVSNTCSTSSGICQFQLYFLNFGSKTITATSSGYSASISLTVNKPLLKLVVNQPSVMNI